MNGNRPPMQGGMNLQPNAAGQVMAGMNLQSNVSGQMVGGMNLQPNMAGQVVSGMNLQPNMMGQVVGGMTMQTNMGAQAVSGMNFQHNSTTQMADQSGIAQMPIMSQYNSSSIPQRMPNMVTANLNQDLLVARRLMREKIAQYIQRNKVAGGDWMQRIPDIVRRLDDLLYKTSTKEEYMNMETLDRRIYSILKSLQNKHNAQVSSSGHVGTMIPTPGMSQIGNRNMVVGSTDSSAINSGYSSTTVKSSGITGGMLQASNGTMTGSLMQNSSGANNFGNGAVTDGFLKSSTDNSLGSGNNLMQSQANFYTSSSQMIPTPGLNGGGNTPTFSGIESGGVSQNQLQVQYNNGNTSSYAMHNLGGQVGVGMRLNTMNNSHGLQNNMLSSSIKAGSAMLEGNQNAPLYNQLQQQATMPGDGYGTIDQAATGNFYDHAVPAASAMNQQMMSSSSLQPKTEPLNTPLSYHSNMQSNQLRTDKYSSFNSSQKMEMLSTYTGPNNLQQSKQQLQNIQHQQINPYDQLIQRQPLQPQNQPQQHDQHLQVDMDPNRAPVWSSARSDHLTHAELGMEQNEALLSQDPNKASIPEVTNQSLQYNASGDPAKANLEYNSKISQKPYKLDQQSFYQQMHSEYEQQITKPDEVQGQIFAEESSYGVQTTVNDPSTKLTESILTNELGNSQRAQEYYKQRKWLLFLRHARRCPAPKGKCLEVHCIIVQNLLLHMGACSSSECGYPRCQKSKNLLKHHRNCKTADCPVCVPVREYISMQCKPCPSTGVSSVYTVDSSPKEAKISNGNVTSSNVFASIETSGDLQSSKRVKVEHPSSAICKSDSSSVSVQQVNQRRATQETHKHIHQLSDVFESEKYEFADEKAESALGCQAESPAKLGSTVGDSENGLSVKSELEPAIPNYIDCHATVKQEISSAGRSFDRPKVETKQDHGTVSVVAPGMKSAKAKIKGVSLIELFTPEQVREHITGLRRWIGQSKAKAEKNQAMERSMNENACQLCAVEKLSFEPPPIYCTPCGARIKKNAFYYTYGSSDTRQYVCVPCYNEARGDSVKVEGTPVAKAKLKKCKNDEEAEEWWVQCDKCEAWQHQICALFNGRRNDGGEAEYTCPNCYAQEVERGERAPLPQSAVLGAEDLPRTLLSDHLEQRLFRRLKQERQERARHLGKSFDEVQGAEPLVIRVVSSVDKKLEVKPRFLEIFQEQNYPTEFPYKSKVILLFQKIEGVEVCLFGMYLQEFGSESPYPNQRRVYLSYLDSVKYFRPETKTVTGEALRTFVYHEILIGYLEYCKIRGFTSCYIWACPPLKGEDYILYCHPEIQKTPKSDKLREWYLAMLRKAQRENIVADLTNFYDHFFINNGECKAKITAARLPYFEGDYWPGAAEDMICQLQEEEEDGGKQQKKGKIRKIITKRALKAAGQTDLSGNAYKDALLMQKLGETIYPMKEDFIMVHLQHACTHCCLLMVSGVRWVCNRCKNFQLCEKCYDVEQRLEERERHPINSKEKHILSPVEINDIPLDTKDKDEILESEFFDTRQAFLSLCQGNHYQYDTLRRAKHSSMMVLYHLHNPTAPAFVTTCNICTHDIEAGQGWRCDICPDFDVCNSCYQKDGGVDHPHKLTNHPSMVDAQNTEARQKRVLQLRKMLDLLVHASQCRLIAPQNLQCQYPNCRKVKGLFRHGSKCPTRASGGCLLCKRMWYLLQLHARACKESVCHVPRCKDLKEHLRRLQHQSDSRRRAAVMEMMRQRAAEVARSSE